MLVGGVDLELQLTSVLPKMGVLIADGRVSTK